MTPGSCLLLPGDGIGVSRRGGDSTGETGGSIGGARVFGGTSLAGRLNVFRGSLAVFVTI